MMNGNVHERKHSGKQPLSELKFSQSVKLIVQDDVIVIESSNFSCGGRGCACVVPPRGSSFTTFIKDLLMKKPTYTPGLLT